MRLFTAIDISAEVRRNLKDFVAKLKPMAKISWSPVDNLHITTKFIGDWPEARLEEMKRALAGVPKLGAMDISIRGVGWFPDERRPRVLWAGVEAPASLTALAAETENAAAGIGVPHEDRKFSPHLTLARIREPIPLNALRDALQVRPKASGAISKDARDAFDFGTFRAEAFFLYLSASGRYTKLAEFSLV